MKKRADLCYMIKGLLILSDAKEPVLMKQALSFDYSPMTIPESSRSFFTLSISEIVTS